MDAIVGKTDADTEEDCQIDSAGRRLLFLSGSSPLDAHPSGPILLLHW
jgi:hypothetical protein